MKNATVTLRSKHDHHLHTPDGKYDFLPMGKYKGQCSEVEEGYFYCDLPTLVEYKDDFGKMKERHKNYAQFVINNYEVEVVEVKEKEIVDAPIVEPKKKGKKNEKLIS
jgi:hypothetical protein